MISNFKYLFKILNNSEKKIFFLMFFFMIIATVLETLSIASILPFIQFIIQNQDFDYLLFVNNLSFENKIYFFLIIILIIFFLKNIFLIFFKNFYTKKINYLRVRVANSLFKKYLSRDYSFFINRNSSELIRNNFNEVGLLSKIVGLTVVMLNEIMTSFGLFILMILVTPIGFLVAFSVIVPFAFLIYFFFRRTLVSSGVQRLKSTDMSLQKLIEGFSAIRDIKNYSAEEYFLKNFNVHSLNLANVNTKIAFINTLPSLILEYLGVITFAIIFLVLFSYQGLSQNEIIPIFSLYILASLRILPSVSRLLVAFQSFKNFSPSLNIIYEELKESDENNKNYYKFNNKLILKDIDFLYDKNKPLFKKLNFEINKGDMIGIYGDSGSGKTTLVNILLGLIKPTNGKILLNKNILTFPFSWNNSIAIVPQTIYVTDETIKQNIAFGIQSKDISLKKINESIRLSRLSLYVDNLKNGADTIVGERGVKMSGGQLQRLGIARALYNDPELIIFDEATSNLDEENEKKIFDLIYSFKGYKTSIIISHNISNLENCDRILNLNLLK
jgi:ATP-binding cassette, subfamily B, bacterial PglK